MATGTTTVPFSDLGKSKSIVHRVVRDGLGTPIKAPHTKVRVGSAHRREQLRGALGLAVIWVSSSKRRKVWLWIAANSSI